MGGTDADARPVPSGRPATRLERITIAAILAFVVPNAVGTLPFDPARGAGCGSDCPANLVSIHPDPGLANIMRTVVAVAGPVLAVLVLIGVLLRWYRATPSARRAFPPVVAGGIVAFGAGLANSIAVSRGTLLLSWARQLAFLALSGGLLAGLLRGWLDRSAIGNLLVQLGSASTPQRLRSLLASALHDPTLELLYWDAARGVYISGERDVAELSAAHGDRAITELGRGADRVGALVHDASLIDEPALIESVAEAARFALENERLQSEVRTQLRELRASRRRIAEVALAERRRVERDLHDGAQQRLVTLSLAVAMAQERASESTDPQLQALLAEVSGQLGEAVTELRELARGIHPALLTEAGLGPALASLAERASLPVTVVCAPARRFSAVVEATTYFVAAEALTNVSKHARASAATVSAQEDADAIVLEVCDDGIGGASAHNGSGLAVLADRVAALAGSLELHSPKGGGTRVCARIPCA